MLEIIKYVTSDFWVFVGTFIILSLVLQSVVSIIKSLKQ